MRGSVAGPDVPIGGTASIVGELDHVEDTEGLASSMLNLATGGQGKEDYDQTKFCLPHPEIDSRRIFPIFSTYNVKFRFQLLKKDLIDDKMSGNN